MFTRKSRFTAQEVHADLTPMIDVVFLLLIFFMVATKFRSLDFMMRLHLPAPGETASTVALDPLETEVRIRLDRQGDYAFWDGHRVPVAVRVMVGDVVIGEYARPQMAGSENARQALDGQRQVVFEYLAEHMKTMKESYQLRGQAMRVVIAPDLRMPTSEVVSALNAVKKAKIEGVHFSASITDLPRLYEEDGIER